jgi:hypothetical protein
MSVVWNTGPAAMRARFNLKLKVKNKKKTKLQAASYKPQAASSKQLRLTSDKLIGYYRKHAKKRS